MVQGRYERVRTRSEPGDAKNQKFRKKAIPEECVCTLKKNNKPIFLHFKRHTLTLSLLADNTPYIHGKNGLGWKSQRSKHRLNANARKVWGRIRVYCNRNDRSHIQANHAAIRQLTRNSPSISRLVIVDAQQKYYQQNDFWHNTHSPWIVLLDRSLLLLLLQLFLFVCFLLPNKSALTRQKTTFKH